LVGHFRRSAREWATEIDSAISSVFVQGPWAFQSMAGNMCIFDGGGGVKESKRVSTSRYGLLKVIADR
jgi:hypothetical protein